MTERVGLVLSGAAAVAARPAGLGVIGAPDARPDVTPLRERAAALFRPDRIAADLAGGGIESLAVAATVCPPARSAARSRLFVQGRLPAPARAVDVVPVDVALDHLLASAAIPGMSPPVLIDEPPVGAGWYGDGGVRLDAPLRPAVDLGCARLVVISGHSLDPPPVPPSAGPYHPPDIASTAAMAVRAILADALGDDVDTLHRKNHRVRHRVVPHLVVAPADGDLAALAAETFAPTGPWTRTGPSAGCSTPWARAVGATSCSASCCSGRPTPRGWPRRAAGTRYAHSPRAGGSRFRSPSSAARLAPGSR